MSWFTGRYSGIWMIAIMSCTQPTLSAITTTPQNQFQIKKIAPTILLLLAAVGCGYFGCYLYARTHDKNASQDESRSESKPESTASNLHVADPDYNVMPVEEEWHNIMPVEEEWHIVTKEEMSDDTPHKDTVTHDRLDTEK